MKSNSIYNVRVAVSKGDLNVANEMLKDIYADVRFHSYILDRTLREVEFVNAALQQFSFVVEDYNIKLDRQEPEYGSIFKPLRFMHCMHTVGDLIDMFFHNALHERCLMLWKNSCIPRNVFIPDHRGVAEEVYSQAMLHVIAPHFHGTFPHQLHSLMTCYGTQHPREHSTIIDMMYSDYISTCPTLTKIHGMIYEHDPLAQQTFDVYTRVLSLAIDNDTSVRLYFNDHLASLDGISENESNKI